MPHAHVVAGPHSALGVDRPGAADVIEERKEVHVREVLSRPAGEPTELDGEQGIPQCTFGRHVMSQIARQRNSGQELREPKLPIRTVTVTSHSFSPHGKFPQYDPDAVVRSKEPEWVDGPADLIRAMDETP
jgi:hypothetical protein